MSQVAHEVDAPIGLNWKTTAGWLSTAVLAVIGLHYFYTTTHFILDTSEASYRDYFPNRGYLFVHVIGGSLALLSGPFQLWSGLRRRVLSWHRAFGFTYLTGVLLGAGGAFYLAAVSPSKPFGFALAVLAFAWIVASAMAFLAIKNRRIKLHKEWMIRSYVLTYSFVSFRFIYRLNVLASLGNDKDATIAWVCWTIPLLLAEVTMQWKHIVRART
jgi:hypothetical protein